MVGLHKDFVSYYPRHPLGSIPSRSPVVRDRSPPDHDDFCSRSFYPAQCCRGAVWGAGCYQPAVATSPKETSHAHCGPPGAMHGGLTLRRGLLSPRNLPVARFRKCVPMHAGQVTASNESPMGGASSPTCCCTSSLVDGQQKRIKAVQTGMAHRIDG